IMDGVNVHGTRLRGAVVFFFSSRRRHTSSYGDWSSDVCSSDLASLRAYPRPAGPARHGRHAARIRSQGGAMQGLIDLVFGTYPRSEERRVGEECRSRGGAVAEME